MVEERNREESQDAEGSMENASPLAIASPFNERTSDEERNNRNRSENTHRSQDSQPNAMRCAQVHEPERLSKSPVAAVDIFARESKTSEDNSTSSDLPTSQEELLRAICDKLPSPEILLRLTKEELVMLESIADRLKRSEETKIEFIWSCVLQFVGLLFVVVFGVYAILAYDAAGVANKQSFEANQISLLTFCLLNPNTTGQMCATVSEQATEPLSALASTILGPSLTITTIISPSPTPISTGVGYQYGSTDFGSTMALSSKRVGSSRPTPTASPGPTVTSSNHLSAPALLGTVIGVVLGLSSILVSFWTFTIKFRKSAHRTARLEGLSSYYI